MNELPGLLKAIEIADAYWQYDFKQAGNKELTSDDREQALNCSCRLGQVISQFKLAISRIQGGEPPREEMPGLQGLIVFTRIFGPPGLLQNNQNEENIHFFWLNCTINVNIKTKTVTINLKTDITAEEAFQYAWLAKEMEEFLKNKEL